MSWILSLTCRNGGGAGVDGGGEQPRVGDGEGRREGVGWRDLGAAEDREHRPCRHIDHLGKGVQLLEHEGSRRPDCKAFAQHRRVAAVGRAKRVVDVNVCELPEMRLERLDLCSVGLDLFAVLFSLARLLDVHPQVLEQNDRAGRRVRAHLLNLPASERRAPVHGGGGCCARGAAPAATTHLVFPVVIKDAAGKQDRRFQLCFKHFEDRSHRELFLKADATGPSEVRHQDNRLGAFFKSKPGGAEDSPDRSQGAARARVSREVDVART